MKRFVSFLPLFLISVLFSQVEFELDFSFEKVDIYDNLVNLQVIDLDQNGESELICFYQKNNGTGLIVTYNANGNIINTFDIPLVGDEEYFLYGKYCTIADQEYIFAIKTFDQSYAKMELKNFETGYTLSSCILENPQICINLQKVNFCMEKDYNNNKIVYVGLQANCYSDAGCSFLYKFFWNSQNELLPLSVRTSFGTDYCEYVDDYSLVVIDDYNFYLDGWVYQEYNYSLMSHEINSSFNNFYSMNGSRYYEEPNFTFDSFPTGLKILNKNDENYENYGMLVGLTVLDSDNGDYAGFRCFEPDASGTIWTSMESQIGIEPLLSSTCIPVNSEDHYVMYFRENQLEIRDRIDGDIIHFQNSSINPINILKSGNEELFFFEEQLDESGYDVYILAEEILVSAEHQLPDIGYELSNFPNPFNPSTKISFSVPQTSSIASIEIFNIKGQKIETFIINPSTDQAINSITWNGTDTNNKPVSSGIYFYQLKVDGKVQKSKKMMLLK
jgi:Secretion system C-terminal sorting domain